MKGGITSGVVYPRAITELAKKFRFSSIGGTSAGAIAAAVAAAAEYGRASGGFTRLEQVPQTLATELFGLFQPKPVLKPVFDVAMAALGSTSMPGKMMGALRAAIAGYPLRSILCALPGLAIAAFGILYSSGGWIALGFVLTLLGVVAGAAWGFARALTKELPANGFGLCSGMTQPGYKTPALTPWLADLIDTIAGRPVGPNDPPLTFGDLKNRGDAPAINLAMMTTNLMMRRPHRLPMEERRFLFNPDDLRQLVPERVFAHMMKFAAVPENIDAPPGTYFQLPEADDFPVVLAARMSLSFPVLISTIPLYAVDYTLKQPESIKSPGPESPERVPRKPQLCLFSDGGLSSNFPIHFFDRLWPNAPTFAITLDEFDPDRNDADDPVWMPDTATSGIAIPIQAISGGLVGFLSRMIDAAKDWQDNLQSTLPGYRERIVHIPLKPSEGGLNLGMQTKTIQTLINYGAIAGDLAATQFDLDEHRWRRFLVAMARIEQTLDEMTDAYNTTPLNGQSFEAFLNAYAGLPKTYKQNPPVLTEILARAKQLVALGQNWKTPPTIRSGKIPKPYTDLRITPKS